MVKMPAATNDKNGTVEKTEEVVMVWRFLANISWKVTVFFLWLAASEVKKRGI